MLLAVILVGGLAASANAATVTLSMDTTGGTANVYASVSGGCEGLAGFIIDITCDGTVALSNADQCSPKGFDAGAGDMFGFKLFDSNGSASGTSIIDITAAQDTSYGDVNDPAKDALVLKAVGQMGGSHEGVTWTAPVKIATVDFTGVGNIYANVGNGYATLLSTTGSWEGPGNCEYATEVTEGSVFVPEPATIGLLGLGVLALLRKRR